MAWALPLCCVDCCLAPVLTQGGAGTQVGSDSVNLGNVLWGRRLLMLGHLPGVASGLCLSLSISGLPWRDTQCPPHSPEQALPGAVGGHGEVSLVTASATWHLSLGQCR